VIDAFGEIAQAPFVLDDPRGKTRRRAQHNNPIRKSICSSVGFACECEPDS
jgi:hypothetical protein